MKQCLLCNEPVKLIKFKSRDGYLCKACYEKVSLNFSQTVKNKSREELQQLYQEAPAQPLFEISRKINQFVLFDDQRQQFCLPNHGKYCKESLKAEIYPFSAVAACELKEDRLLAIAKKELFLGTIKVQLQLNGASVIQRELWLVAQPIQIDSLAYRTMHTLAEKIVAKMQQLIGVDLPN